MSRRVVAWTLAGIVVLGGALQLVPYGHTRGDPAVRREPAWDSPRTRDLTVRACYDCHSNQTVWPWYASVAPISWLLQSDVETGRRRLNFSEWDRAQRGARPQGLERRINSGSMPPWYYLLMHSNAKLGAAEKQALRDGLERTVTQDPPASH